MEQEDKRKELVPLLKKAKTYAWITIGYLIFDVTILIMVSQNSQAMKAAWVEDILFFIPSISFLIASNFASKPPNKKFRFGYSRAYTVGLIVSSVALLGVGSFLFIESLMKLVSMEVISIGTLYIFDHTIWFGWIMIAVVGNSLVPAYLLGKKKLELSNKLNIQMLYIDAKGQKADWLTSAATIVGVLGIGFGVWWADAAAAIIISLDILSDGFKSINASISETMDRTPLDPHLKREEPLVKAIEDLLKKEDWVKKSLVRFRKSGNKTTGEILIVLKTSENMLENIYQLQEKIKQQHRHITNVVVSPVKDLPELYEKQI